MSMQAMARWLGEPKKVALLLLAAGLAAVAALGVAASAASAATFSNTDGPITINDGSEVCPEDGGVAAAPGKATPYPSVIAVDGLDSSVTDVNVTITGLSHTFPDDVSLLLVSPAGQSTLLMTDSGSQFDVSDINLTFDDEAPVDPGTLPNQTLIESGTYLPSLGSSPLGFGCNAPASFPKDAAGTNPPAGLYGTSLTVFDGSDPNGTWKLYIIDDTIGDVGSISSWSLDISTTTTADTTPPTVTTSTPTNKAESITATFSEEVQNVSPETFFLERKISVKKEDPKYVRVDATVSLINGIYVLDPVQDLPKGEYRATITTDVTDMADNALEDPEVWTFKVAK